MALLVVLHDLIGCFLGAIAERLNADRGAYRGYPARSVWIGFQVEPRTHRDWCPLAVRVRPARGRRSGLASGLVRHLVTRDGLAVVLGRRHFAALVVGVAHVGRADGGSDRWLLR